MGRDKVLHFAAGAVIASAAYALTGSLWAAVLAAALAGAAKEAYDATGRGTVDAVDFAATLAGALLPAFYHYSQGQGA